MSYNFNFTDASYEETYNFNFGLDVVVTYYSILKGVSNNFVSIWADSDSSEWSGRLYVSDSGYGSALSVVDLSSQALIDFYTFTQPGGFNESLEEEDIKDINITGTG